MSTTYYKEPRKSLRKQLVLLLRAVKNKILSYYYYTKKEEFTFHSHIYNYFFHNYNATWENERAVEIPIILAALSSLKGKKILEVGNVLQHYGFTGHDVVDKYEGGVNVLNSDIADFKPVQKYDCIVSISTLEHVGWDEEPREPKKFNDAIRNISENCLAKGGTLIVTLPVGYNSYVDKYLAKQPSALGELFFLKKVSKRIWEEVPYEKVRDTKYNYPFSASNAICISFYIK
ncbi:MAG: hypothetical protein AAB071_04385 [Bacteroidota bacterium]